jgi:hypothetical protein
MEAGGHETSEVRDIRHDLRTHVVGNGSERRKVELSRVG